MNWLPFIDEKDLEQELQSPVGRTTVADKPGGRGRFIDGFNCGFCFNDVKKGLRAGRCPKMKSLVPTVL